jgi:hypothetical protein
MPQMLAWSLGFSPALAYVILATIHVMATGGRTASRSATDQKKDA